MSITSSDLKRMYYRYDLQVVRLSQRVTNPWWLAAEKKTRLREPRVLGLGVLSYYYVPDTPRSQTNNQFWVHTEW